LVIESLRITRSAEAAGMADARSVRGRHVLDHPWHRIIRTIATMIFVLSDFFTFGWLLP
jgi:hypothetical protein